MVDSNGGKDTPGQGRRVFTAIFPGVYFTTISINHKYSCIGVFNFILPSQTPYEDSQEEDFLMSPVGTKRTCMSQSSYAVAVPSAMRYLMYQPAMSDTTNHASTRRQARTAAAGGEKESSVPE